jgi:chemotaxis protein MotB
MHLSVVMTQSSVATLVLLLAASACVPSGKYDEAVANSERVAAQLRASKLSAAEKDRALAKLDSNLKAVDARNSQQAAELQALAERLATTSRSLDEATAQGQQLRAELERQGKNVDQLLSSKGALASSLAEARARMEELRRAQAAADARANLFRDLALRLKKMIDAGELEIKLRSGRMVLALPTDVLFDSGKAKLSARGKEAITQVSSVLATLKDRRFQVAGHTDADPIRYSGFDSNWELSSARALQVLKVLVDAGMSQATLSAAGYGEFDPVAANDSPDQKAKNRRIEIALQPNIDELVAVPQPR